MTELWDYPKYGCPFKRGDMYYYFYNSGLQNQRFVRFPITSLVYSQKTAVVHDTLLTTSYVQVVNKLVTS